MSTPALIPVTVLTGFLGSGKTTLLNRILHERHGRRIAVIENEFGEVGVDDQLVIRTQEEIFEMNNGCICCTVRGDLVRILAKLAARPQPPEAVLIETTGLADPGPVAQTFFTAPEVASHYSLDGIVTLVDAKHIGLHLDDAPEAAKQIAFADLLVLNKTDLVSPAELDALEARLQRINAAAKLLRARQGDVPIDRVLGLGGFKLARATELDPQFLEPEYPFEWGGVYELPAGDYVFELAGGPDPEMDLAILPVRSAAETDTQGATETAALLFSGEFIRLQSGDPLVAFGDRQRLLLPGEHHRFPLRIARTGHFGFFTQHHPDEFTAQLRPDKSAQPRTPVWAKAFKPDHEHDEEVTSVGIVRDGDLDSVKLDAWLNRLLAEKGTDIFRSKGVLAVRGSAERIVFQGVHMLFNAVAERPWAPGEPRRNTLVFIGRDIDRAELVADFEACLVR